jgi:hypothetical protein
MTYPIPVRAPDGIYLGRINGGEGWTETDVAAVCDGFLQHVATVPREQGDAVKKLLTALWFARELKDAA